ncbi:hypothetical protein MLD38_010816 [Melastoma candidum]|uniref:Uncharacterized protein n=1 Tax=Melastoma candidum TaxID=119954 RepID=A0ACB9R1M4_9MYRT|nr:hypothetical protein MLD38_010816 [Melastoma candidum]
MLEEPQLCASRILSPFRDESGDEELSVLPRHTKVVVTGNNRTKSVLVGLQGVVKKAVGLGGWHWLVLKNGVEVKLQRNALSVLEHPTGNEEDDPDFDSSSGSEICGKDQEFSSINFCKTNKPRVRHTRPWISGSANSLDRGNYRDVHSFMQRPPRPRVNLARLGTKSLWRYCKHYKLPTRASNLGRLQMLYAVQHHFVSQRLNEGEVIIDFVRAINKMKKASRYNPE